MKRLVLLALIAATLPAVRANADVPVKEYIEIPIDGQTVRACRQYVGSLDEPRDVIFEWTAYSIETGYSYQPTGGCSPQFQALVERMAPDGYVHIAANPPGMGRSSGSGMRLWDNGPAGAQAIAWIAAQPWSTGRVGMVGCSGSAMDGLPVVVENPPALRASVMACFAVDAYRGAFYPGGIRHFTNFVFGARFTHDVDLEKGQPLEELQRGETTFANRLANVADTTRLAYTTTTDDLYWQQKSTVSKLADPALKAHRAPILALASWQDMFSGGFEFAMGLQNPHDRTIIYPGWHGSMYTIGGTFGGVERTAQWLDHHIRGATLSFAGEEPVVFYEQLRGFILGVEAQPIEGRMFGAGTWPPADVQWLRYHFGAGPAGASTSLNDGALTTTAPGTTEPGDAYAYPAAAPGSTTDPRGFGISSSLSAELEDAGALTYTTPPVAEPMHIAGPIDVRLWATSTATDTDFIVRLLDVAPDGSFTDITNGYLKASHRTLDATKTMRNADGDIIRAYHTHRTPSLLAPLKPTEYHVELWSTATEVPAGHRLKVWISSQEAAWLTQDVPPAINTILHDAAHPSSILLPVLPAAALEPAL